ncbi:MAG: phosphatidate cytidylyltransferase [Ruminococcus sp.]|nr:phosphatidate cytidylyltransferase [Ruminococcus sp.]
MRTRLISAGVGLVIVFTVLWLHTTIVLPAAVGAIIGIMLFEMLRAVKMEKCLPVLLAVEAAGVSLPVLVWLGQEKFSFLIDMAAVFVVFLTWLRRHKDIKYDQIMFSLASMMLIPQSMACLVRLDKLTGGESVLPLVLGLGGAWIADSAAYFTGVALGKHKLCPEISPKKTIEGFVGGIVVTGIVFVAIIVVHEIMFPDTIQLHQNKVIVYAGFCLIGMVSAAVGTLGDLSASMIKRQIGFKDYGNIMPGHGGMMDRFDSVLFVAPAFYALLELITIK